MPQLLLNKVDRFMDFIYGYFILKAYIFKLRFNEDYYNFDYMEKWKKFLKKSDFKKLLHIACDLMKDDADGKVLDIVDVMERSSYFALIHPGHPNITLGFLKDADLWNLWLENGIYKYARETISEIYGIGNGDKIVDFGCGSVSPSFYAELVGEYGFYAGIDYSKPLLRIANSNCREKNLSDRVKLIQSFVDTKMEFGRRYDIAVLSSILEYSDMKGVLRNAINALHGDGKIVIFSELFTDIHPEREELFNLYYSLIPNFRKFPSVGEIKNILNSFDVLYKIKLHGSHFLVVEVFE